MDIPELPPKGKCILFRQDKKKSIWRIYQHPDNVLDNFAIVEKEVKGKKPEKRWIVSKDYPDWVRSIVEMGFTYSIEEN